MVSTRRSRSQVEDSEQAPVHGSQEDVSSRPKATAVLEPISEHTEAAAAAAATPRTRRQRGQKPAEQEHVQQLEDLEQPQQQAVEQQQERQQERQQQRLEQLGQQMQQPWPTLQQQPMTHDNDGSDSDSDSMDLDGPGVLQNLAAAIRSGFQSHVRHQVSSQQPAAAAAAASRSSHKALDDDAELLQLRWRPHTGLQVPSQVAAAVTAPHLKPKQRKQQQQQQQDQEHVGALVDTAAATQARQLQQQQDSPSAAAAAKPPGLSKSLYAPSLDAAARAKEAKKAAPDTAGDKWFGLPAPKLTDELKRDLRVLRLRGAYDPKRFYKSFDNTKFPKYFAVGTVVDDPLDNDRLPKGQRQSTLTEQLLVDSTLTATRKRRFNKLQDEAQKWSKKGKKQKTGQLRKNPAKHRPKH